MYYMYVCALDTIRVRILLPFGSQFSPHCGQYPLIKDVVSNLPCKVHKKLQGTVMLGFNLGGSRGPRTKKRREHSSQ